MSILMCPYCTTQLEVGDHPRAIVAVCNPQPPGKIQDCPQPMWGSPKTRVSIESDADWEDREGKKITAHAVQLDPPLTEEERRVLAMAPQAQVEREAALAHAEHSRDLERAEHEGMTVTDAVLGDEHPTT